jgi:hypothetical protein
MNPRHPVLAVAQGASESDAKQGEECAEHSATVAQYDSDADFCHPQAKVGKAVGLRLPLSNYVAQKSLGASVELGVYSVKAVRVDSHGRSSNEYLGSGSHGFYAAVKGLSTLNSAVHYVPFMACRPSGRDRSSCQMNNAMNPIQG